MKIIIQKQGQDIKLVLQPEDTIDDSVLPLLEGAVCKIVNQREISDEVTLSYGLVIEKQLPQPEKTKKSFFLKNIFSLL